jgi:hypothetical protein
VALVGLSQLSEFDSGRVSIAALAGPERAPAGRSRRLAATEGDSPSAQDRRRRLASAFAHGRRRRTGANASRQAAERPKNANELCTDSRVVP